MDCEFWNRDDEGSVSDEDISNSDGNIVVSNINFFRALFALIFSSVPSVYLCCDKVC